MPKKKVLIATSDLHLGHTEIEDIVAMVQEIKTVIEKEELSILALLLLGDIGESLKDIEMTLLALHDLAPVRVCVPGNHDVFDTERMGSSLHRYQALLPAVAVRHGYVWGIQDRPIIIDDTAIVTTTAWPRPETVIGRVELDQRDVRAARENLPDERWITQKPAS